jgi:hypothetical protein
MSHELGWEKEYLHLDGKSQETDLGWESTNWQGESDFTIAEPDGPSRQKKYGES